MGGGHSCRRGDRGGVLDVREVARDDGVEAKAEFEGVAQFPYPVATGCGVPVGTVYIFKGSVYWPMASMGTVGNRDDSCRNVTKYWPLSTTRITLQLSLSLVRAGATCY